MPNQPQVPEEAKSILQILDLEIERCQELGDVWAEEGVDSDVLPDPSDRARFFHGQRDKLAELKADFLSTLPTILAAERERVKGTVLEEVRVLLRLDWNIEYLESIDLTTAGEHSLFVYLKVKEALDHLEAHNV